MSVAGIVACKSPLNKERINMTEGLIVGLLCASLSFNVALIFWCYLLNKRFIAADKAFWNLSDMVRASLERSINKETIQ